MRTKKNRIISAAVAMVMFLTSCSKQETNSFTNEINSSNADEHKNNTDSGEIENNYNVYINSQVTYVDNQQMTMNGVTGSYTGDWKGDRPEGSGELILNDGDYYKGTWENGFLSGQGEIRKTEEGGVVKHYIGECSFSSPSGNGVMDVTVEGDPNSVLVKGDFSDEGSPMYFCFDEEGRLVDIGDFANGDCITYLDNFEVNGMVYIPPSNQKAGTSYDYSIGAEVTTVQHGEYFGEIDGNGLPCGYGYLRLTNNKTYNTGKTEQIVQYLGEWKNGECEGLVMWLENTEGSYIVKSKTFFGGTKEENVTFTSNKKAIGNVKDGKFVDDRVLYSNYISDPPQPSDGLKITWEIMGNDDWLYGDHYYNDAKYYSLCEDGTYTTPYEREEYYHTSGYYGYSQRRFICKDGEQFTDYDPEKEDHWYVSPDMVEGEYCHFDKDGNATDYGIPNGYDWKSTKPVKDNTELNQAITVVGTIAFIGLAVYIGSKFDVSEDSEEFKSSSAGKYLAARRQEIAGKKASAEMYDKYIEEAKKAVEWGDYYEADKLYSEAQKYKVCWF